MRITEDSDKVDLTKIEHLMRFHQNSLGRMNKTRYFCRITYILKTELRKNRNSRRYIITGESVSYERVPFLSSNKTKSKHAKKQRTG